MKSWKKYIGSLLLIGTITSLTLGFVSCTKDAPFSPNSAKDVHFSSEITKDVPFSTNSVANEAEFQSSFQIIKWGRNSSRVFKVSKWISKLLGGNVHLSARNGGSKINLNFLVLPLSINETTNIALAVDGRLLEFEFGPSGTTFSPSAILNIVAEGLELSGVNPNSVNFFYHNPIAGQWEPVQSQLVEVNILLGTIEVQAALIPHFSRYAIAISR